MLMVSHDLEQVRRVADRVTVLDRRVVAEGAAEILATASVRELLPAVARATGGARMTALLRLDRRPGATRRPAGRFPVSVSRSRLPVRARARADPRRREPPGRHAAHGLLQRGARPGGASPASRIGLLLGEPLNAPYGGMFGFCLLSTLAMVYVKRHATLPPDTLIGVFHALTLGLGLCLLVALTRQFNVHQVESVLFGSLLTVTDGDLALLLAVGDRRGGAAGPRVQPPAARQPEPAARVRSPAPNRRTSNTSSRSC